MSNLLKYLVITFAGASILWACGGNGQKTAMTDFNNGLTEQEKQAGVFTPEVMWKMGRIGTVAMSPDGSRAVFTLASYNMEENKGNTSLWLLNSNGGDPVRITDAAGNDSDPCWSADGSKIYFLSDRGDESQIWSVDPDTKTVTKISDIKGGVEGYGISPKGDKAFYTQRVHVEKRASSEIYPDLDKSKALIYDDLMVRHWNYWDKGDYYHIFIADVNEGKVSEGKDIMPGEPWDAPMAPYFDIKEIAWNNTGTQLAYTCKKLTGYEYSVSTDSDIYLYDIATGQTRNITEGMVGYEKYPVFSPDGNRIAFRSMERAGNESDKERLFVIDIQTGDKKYITHDFDYNASDILWENGESLLFISPIEATHQICRAGLDGKVTVLTEGDHDITAFTKGGDNVMCLMTKITMAPEIFKADLSDGAITQLTNVNKEIYDNIKPVAVEKRWVTTTDGKQMLTWVITPPNFDPSKKYPVLLYCQGGPQSVVSQFFSFRWNFMLMASQGYVIVAPNRRGLPSFGQEWLDQISGDYSGQNMRDYLSAIDDVSKEPWADKERMGCIGASYGGYSAFFLAGNHNKRFKAFIAHCGIYNFESMYGSTEELWFVNNDYGGSYWSKNPVAMRSYANSPHKFIQNWDAPILIITGLNDFRIPYTQSLEAFTAARVRGLDARLVAFENEAHQVFKPQNSLAWNREFFGWLDKYVKKE